MTTRDASGDPALMLPEELRIPLGLLPTSTATPTAAIPTPGMALAGARLPGGPTLPDPAAAPSARMPTAALSPPAPLTPTASVPTTPPSPFAAPLDFTGVIDGALAMIPLLDVGAPDAELPARDDRSAAQAWPDTAGAYELQPITGLELDSHAGTPFDPHAVRREFPILEERVHGKRLVWLDNAATTQKPQVVIDRLRHFYEHENSNIHRAAHTLAARATDAYESARESVRRFIHAPSVREIVFVRGTTEGINLIAQSWGRRHVGEGDEIVITWLEHHANIVPWQRLCAETGARLRVAPVDDRGQIILDEYEKLLGPRTKLVAFTQVSNALGTITPASQMIELAHRYGAKVVLDGAQSVSHMPVDVRLLDCDFFVFSGHKVFAPTGIGVVFGKYAVLEAMPPWQGGGNMIEDVTFERTIYQKPPARFEAGTGNIADAVGLGAALDWLSRIGVANVGRYEHELLGYATAQLATVPGLTMIGTAAEKAGVLSFVLDGQRTEEVGGLLDREGIAVRSGHHCAQPILRRFGVEATVRASLAPYNTYDDIDALVAALHRIQTGTVALR
jgi:cysteine desulfurase/selenocysteine lyase